MARNWCHASDVRVDGRVARNAVDDCYPTSGLSVDSAMQVEQARRFPGAAPGFKLEDTGMNRLTIALITSALWATTASAAPTLMDALEGPTAKEKQQEVQATAVYPQEGATSGKQASQLAQQRDKPPVLATTQEKKEAVAAAAVYPQEGATSGKQSAKMREQRDMPPLLGSMREKQETVAAVTQANAGA